MHVSLVSGILDVHYTLHVTVQKLYRSGVQTTGRGLIIRPRIPGPAPGHGILPFGNDKVGQN